MCNLLEKMGDFFDTRLDGYDAHMLADIEGATAFYPFTAKQLPIHDGAHLLDLGCGTGLELEFYFKENPTARVTGIDLAAGMLDALRNKFSDKALTLYQGSYFDLPLGEGIYDAAVSVESLHHFTKEEKLPLYKKIYGALKSGGYFILTDYFALTEADEHAFRQTFLGLKAAQGLSDTEFYHYDTPLTMEHETEALLAGGFSTVEVLGQWGATCCLKVKK